MNTVQSAAPALFGRHLYKTFRRDNGEVARAIDDVSLEAKFWLLTALVGPDGAGKTTLIRLAAGLMPLDSGELSVCGIDVAQHPHEVQTRIGYMPQRFGLYEDLSVQENLDLYADLHGVRAEERQQRYPQLLEMTALGPFTDRLAGRLSGGMKQKLGLACTLIRAPELLLLDEPTVGVDPLSRRDLWTIILQLVNAEGLTVLLSTSYLDEAERCRHVIVMHEGKVLAEGCPAEVNRLAERRVFRIAPPAGLTARALQSRLLDDPEIIDAIPEGGQVRLIAATRGADRPAAAGSEMMPVPARFEDGFMVLLRQNSPAPRDVAMTLQHRPHSPSGEAVVEVRDLVRRFGAFTAVDHVSFEVRRGEIFGLLGPNGAGKTTTFRMLCGLLPASQGTLLVAGADLGRARAAARQKLGYVAQKFALYGDLSDQRESRVFCQRLWASRRAPAPSHRLGAPTVRARASRRDEERSFARRIQAAAGDGGCAAP
jgi:ABC-2 type transport system ATP-binding protein